MKNRLNALTREEWLNRGMTRLAPLFTKISVKVPSNIKVSCGLPSKGAFANSKRRIGECWSDACSEGKVFEIFISPTISNSLEALATLIHEMVHAIVGLKCGHRGEFKKVAEAVGLQGPMRSTSASPKLKEALTTIVDKLGKYPHSSLMKLTNNQTKQSARLLKIECTDCGYVVRVTRKWIEVGLPSCCCGGEFAESIVEYKGPSDE